MKMYNADAAENSGGFKVIGESSLSSLMNREDVKGEPKEETPEAQKETTPEVQKETPEVKEEIKEPPKEEPKEDPKEEVKTEAKAAPQEVDFDEVLKKQDRVEVLKKLGLDDFEIAMLDYRKQHGDLTPYLEAKLKDWDKTSDEEVVRHDLRRQHQELSDEEFETLYKRKVLKAYSLGDDFEEEERREGKIMLKSEAAKIRRRLKEEQAKFGDPGKSDDAAKNLEDQERQREQAIQQYTDTVKKDPATIKLLEGKRIVAGSGNETFNYEVNPNELLDVAFSPNKIFDFFANGRQTNFEDFYATVAFAKNRKQYEKALIDYGKTLGSKEVVEEDLQNLSKPETASPAKKEETLSEAFANRGIHKPLGSVLR